MSLLYYDGGGVVKGFWKFFEFKRLFGDKVLENRGFLHAPFWGFSKIPTFFGKRNFPAVGKPLFSSV